MKRVLAAITMGILLGAALRAQTQQPTPPKPEEKKAAVSVAGKWMVELASAMGQSTPALDLKQDGEKITGTYTGRYGVSPVAGTLKDHAIEMKISVNVEGQEIEVWYSGEVAADAQTMKGTATLGPAGDATWLARRQKS